MPAGRTCDSGIPIVIAHEIGQAIGLRHNSDARALMCGRPASCRPDAFASQTEHYFLLTAEEKSLLLVLYPADWRARQSPSIRASLVASSPWAQSARGDRISRLRSPILVRAVATPRPRQQLAREQPAHKQRGAGREECGHTGVLQSANQDRDGDGQQERQHGAQQGGNRDNRPNGPRWKTAHACTPADPDRAYP